eukprot:TRINITY_DN12234_c0_g1_i2.p1 TRINITY_DN12234_c0_g1~~TRINITY_DN12234_c0_g1_i2.p1  ORF type:complete len:100 (+),score=4.17 TRINITY_DN12234_c0_g1_i2:556-855(+)
MWSCLFGGYFFYIYWEHDLNSIKKQERTEKGMRKEIQSFSIISAMSVSPTHTTKSFKKIPCLSKVQSVQFSITHFNMYFASTCWVLEPPFTLTTLYKIK